MPCVLTLLLGLACDPGTDFDPIQIADSNECSEGIRAEECVRVPPRGGSIPVEIDGQMGDREYWGAVELPVTSVSLQRASRMFVLLEDETQTLRVFLDQIAVELNSTELFIVFDHKRFENASPLFGTEDRRLVANVDTGNVQMEELSDGGIWGPTAEPFDAVASCFDDVTENLTRCSIELAIPLPESAFVAPTADTLPGIGLGVFDDAFLTGQPEELADTEGAAAIDRRSLTTLLFGRPQGVPLSIMSWNVARWGEGLEASITQDPFGDVPLASIAATMVPHDIVMVRALGACGRGCAFGRGERATRPRWVAGVPPGRASFSVSSCDRRDWTCAPWRS